jgi:hypothetical protein
MHKGNVSSQNCFRYNLNTCHKTMNKEGKIGRYHNTTPYSSLLYPSIVGNQAAGSIAIIIARILIIRENIVHGIGSIG